MAALTSVPARSTRRDDTPTSAAIDAMASARAADVWTPVATTYAAITATTAADDTHRLHSNPSSAHATKAPTTTR